MLVSKERPSAELHDHAPPPVTRHLLKRRPRAQSAAAALAALVFSACGSLPRDPEKTLAHVRAGRLRVGLVESPPWVVHTASGPGGVEIDLLRELAAEVGATPEWHWGGEQQHMEALEEFELDVVAGGLTDASPWASVVALTRPYYDERLAPGPTRHEHHSAAHVLAAPPGENGWLDHLERFLEGHRAAVAARLASEESRP
jgi:polar amino acid transport system substrate-binding protein